MLVIHQYFLYYLSTYITKYPNDYYLVFFSLKLMQIWVKVELGWGWVKVKWNWAQAKLRKIKGHVRKITDIQIHSFSLVSSCKMVAWESVEAEKFSSGEKTHHPLKMEKNKIVLKCFLGQFECFKQLFFLVENCPILTPPP